VTFSPCEDLRVGKGLLPSSCRCLFYVFSMKTPSA
jgi:hypothetical protein